jgi:hypothetical protein
MCKSNVLEVMLRQLSARANHKKVPCGEVMTAAKSNHETDLTAQAKSSDVPEVVVATFGGAENEDVPERYQTREDLEKALNEAKKSEAHLRKIIDTTKPRSLEWGSRAM